MKSITKVANIRYLTGDGYNFDMSFAFKSEIEDILQTRGKKNKKNSKEKYDKKVGKI